MALAQEVKDALLKKWSDVEAIGVFGSVARGEDTRWSDLDMICIVKSTSQKEDLFFTYRGVTVWVEVWSKPYIMGKIQEPEPIWPISTNKWYEVVPLYDPYDIFRELRKCIEILPTSFYIKGMEDSLIDACLELNKMRAGHEAGDEIETRDAAHRFAEDLALFIAYLNRTFYKRGRKSLFKEYKEFKDVPLHYGDEIHKLAGHVFVDIPTLIASAERVWVECMKIAQFHDVGLREKQSLE